MARIGAPRALSRSKGAAAASAASSSSSAPAPAKRRSGGATQKPAIKAQAAAASKRRQGAAAAPTSAWQQGVTRSRDERRRTALDGGAGVAPELLRGAETKRPVSASGPAM